MKHRDAWRREKDRELCSGLHGEERRLDK